MATKLTLGQLVFAFLATLTAGLLLGTYIGPTSGLFGLLRGDNVFPSKSTRPILIPDPSTRPHVKLVVSVGSAPNKRPLRDAIRETWGAWLREKGAHLYFFTDNTPEMLEESNEHADLVLQTVPSGYRNFLSRFFFQMEWFLERYDADYILRLDDDGFLCVEQLFSLLEVFPRERFFYGKYFCASAKRVADENIMLFSQDVVRNLSLMRPLLRVNARATFAAHFGMWQHFLDIDVFDDQMRIDSQVNGPRTDYMHTDPPKPGEEFDYAANSTYGDFCNKFVWAHHVHDPSVVRRVFDNINKTASVNYDPVAEPLNSICYGHPVEAQKSILRPTQTTLGGNFPTIQASPSYGYGKHLTNKH